MQTTSEAILALRLVTLPLQFDCGEIAKVNPALVLTDKQGTPGTRSDDRAAAKGN